MSPFQGSGKKTVAPCSRAAVLSRSRGIGPWPFAVAFGLIEAGDIEAGDIQAGDIQVGNIEAGDIEPCDIRTGTHRPGRHPQARPAQDARDVFYFLNPRSPGPGGGR